MATNIVYEDGDQLSLAPTVAPGATALSGDPVLIGDLPGVMLTDADDTVANAGEGTVKLNGVARLSVVGEGSAGAAAIGRGDILAIDTDAELNADTTNGTRFGYALEAVSSGATTEILVKIGY